MSYTAQPGLVSTRNAVRDNVVALLTGTTLAGQNVESNRASDTEPADMPFIGVYTGHEMKTLTSDAGTDPLLDATLTIGIDVRVSALRIALAENQLDLLIDQVQAALFTAPGFWMRTQQGGRIIRRISRVEIKSAVRGESEAYIGLAQIEIDVEYSDLFQTAIPDTWETLTIAIEPNAPPPSPRDPPPPVTVDISIVTPAAQTE
jgi:hypothetical protein